MSKSFDKNKPFVMRLKNGQEMKARILDDNYLQLTIDPVSKNYITVPKLMVAALFTSENSNTKRNAPNSPPVIYETCYIFNEDGTMCYGIAEYTLVNIPVKKSGWVNLYVSSDFGTRPGDVIHETEELAIAECADVVSRGQKVFTAKIEWEE